MERINSTFTADSVEEIIANLTEQQGKGDEWARQTLEKLRKVSPLR